MKANELIIGDWIRCDGEPYRIAEIGGMVCCLDYERELFAALEDIEPIPLTPEILEKNFPTYEGLVFEPSDMLDTISAFTFRIDEDFAHIKIDLRYVHELQHTLRLCGIEKEIKL